MSTFIAYLSSLDPMTETREAGPSGPPLRKSPTVRRRALGSATHWPVSGRGESVQHSTMNGADATLTGWASGHEGLFSMKSTTRTIAGPVTAVSGIRADVRN